MQAKQTCTISKSKVWQRNSDLKQYLQDATLVLLLIELQKTHFGSEENFHWFPMFCFLFTGICVQTIFSFCFTLQCYVVQDNKWKQSDKDL